MENEKRLIDVNKVINSMQKCLDEASDKNSVAYLTFEGLIECMKQEPTVDAVEVVRCKDCRGTMSGIMHPSGRCLCERISRWVSDNDFCSNGEKR